MWKNDMKPHSGLQRIMNSEMVKIVTIRRPTLAFNAIDILYPLFLSPIVLNNNIHAN